MWYDVFVEIRRRGKKKGSNMTAKGLEDFKLPRWDDLPPVDLYLEQILELLGERLDGIEYCREIHQQQCEDVVQVSKITEHHVQRRKYKPHTKVEYNKAAYRIKQKYEFPCEQNSVYRTENE